jgi:hypothetical protein
MDKKEEQFFMEQLGKSFQEFKEEADSSKSGYFSTSASSGYYSKSASSGYFSTSASSGNSSTSASSGNSSTSASSGYFSTSASSGESSTSASSGYSSTSASSGNSSTSASSGEFSKSASSGYSSTSASSGEFSKSECKGEKSSALANGYFSKVKGHTDGSLIGCTEYDKDYNPISIAYGIIGKDLKPDVWYLAYKGKLVEVVEVDGIQSGLLYKRGNVMKVVNSDMQEGYIVTNESGVSAHGKTIKEAREALVYKVTSRDLSEFEYLTENTELSFDKAIEAYHSITGACSQGMQMFIDEKGIKKDSYKVSEIIELTKGAYGGERFKEFINENN